MATANLLNDNDVLDVGYDEISLPKLNRQVLILDPKTLVDFETKESDIRERCPGVGRAHSKPPELSMHA